MKEIQIKFKDVDFRLDNNVIITCNVNDLDYSDEYNIIIDHPNTGPGYWSQQFVLLHLYSQKYGKNNMTIYLDDKDNSTCYECKVIKYDKKRDIKLHLKTII